jgi:hypothetical protein
MQICPEGTSLTWTEVIELCIKIGTAAPSYLSLGRILAVDQLRVHTNEVLRELRVRELNITSDLKTIAGIFRAFSMPVLERLTIRLSLEVAIEANYILTYPKALHSLRKLHISAVGWTDVHNAVLHNNILRHLLPQQLESVSFDVAFDNHSSSSSSILALSTNRPRVKNLYISSIDGSKGGSATLAMLAWWDPEHLKIKLPRDYWRRSSGPDPEPNPSSVSPIRLDRLLSLEFPSYPPERFLQFISHLDIPRVQRISLGGQPGFSTY